MTSFAEYMHEVQLRWDLAASKRLSAEVEVDEWGRIAIYHHEIDRMEELVPQMEEDGSFYISAHVFNDNRDWGWFRHSTARRYDSDVFMEECEYLEGHDCYCGG